MRIGIYIIAGALISIALGCTDSNDTNCAADEMVFAGKACISADSELVNYFGVLDFYCTSDSMVVQYSPAGPSATRIRCNNGSGGSNGEEFMGDKYLYCGCSPLDDKIESSLESTTIVLSLEELSQAPDQITARVYQLSGPIPTAERLDSTTVTLSRR